MSDFVTVLGTYGPVLTKIYKADGGVDTYDNAGSFKSREVPVTDIHDLSAKLTVLQDKTTSCIIRGKLVAKPEPGKVAGSLARSNASFDDCPHHWLMIDIDKYAPGFADPVTEVPDAVQDFLEDAKLQVFKGCSFHWQLSSSAGMKPGILKCHVWFWSETAYTSAQMYAWAQRVGILVDKAVYRRVQIHYTANPIFEEGRTDPVAVRSGFYQGARDTVPLTLDGSVLESARETASGKDTKLVDPSEKEGLVGAYHRAFDAHTVLMEHLEGMFEPGVNDRRWTWLDGGGTPEGVWVHDDGMHIHATHNTWPFDGIVNLWDLVRVLKFGDKDTQGDDFDKMDAASTPIQGRPSNLAMIEWVKGLPEIVEEDARARMGAVDVFKAELAAAPDRITLETVISPAIRSAKLNAVDREVLKNEMQVALKRVTGVKVPIKVAGAMVTPAREQMAGDAPDWAEAWVWDSETDCFVEVDKKIFITERSYNARYDRMMTEFADSNGNVPKAADYSLRVWRTRIVDRTQYLPAAYNPKIQDKLTRVIYTEDEMVFFNLYQPNTLAIPDRLTKNQRAAIAVLEEHLEMLLPDERERRLFVDYLAYCVKFPGKKIRWAPLLKGIEGDGKSAFVILMHYCLGRHNVRVLDSATLEKSDFSGWSTGQCFTGVEEIKLHGHNRYDVYNKLKPYISNDYVEVHRKGKDPYNVPNTTNYLLLTNFDDGVPVTDNDRRIMFLSSPFRSKEEMFAAVLERTGLASTEYFDRLFDKVIKEEAGAICRWLMDRELSPEFSPDGRAPITEARERAVDLSMMEDEIAVRAVLEEQALGVYPTMLSTWHLTQQVRDIHNLVIRNTRYPIILEKLGFTKAKKQVKWRGRVTWLYVRGAVPGYVQAALEKLETARQADLIGEEFGN